MNSKKKNICIVLTTRGNYAKMKTTMRAIKDHEHLNLQVVLGGGLLLSRFREYENDLIKDGFKVDANIEFLENNGSSPIDMAISSSNAIKLLTKELVNLMPDVIIVIADRYEALAIAMCAVCLNIPIAHLEGGEVSGSIDERIRHSITKLSHIHFPSNREAKERLVKLGEPVDSIHVVGSPSIDLIKNLNLDDLSVLKTSSVFLDNQVCFEFEEPYFVVSQHPVVTEHQQINKQINEIIKSILYFKKPVIWLLPNMDAGNQEVSNEIKKNIDNLKELPVYVLPSLPIEEYSILLKNSLCLIGNSSSGIRECEFIGVPVVNIGTRQSNRTIGANVISVDYKSEEIINGIKKHLNHGPYKSEYLYGNGMAGKEIANKLAITELKLEKTITY